LNSLAGILQGFAHGNVVPICVVLMGDFHSNAASISDIVEEYEANFRALGNMIGSFPEIAGETTFIFVPGPLDPVRNRESRSGHVWRYVRPTGSVLIPSYCRFTRADTRCQRRCCRPLDFQTSS